MTGIERTDQTDAIQRAEASIAELREDLQVPDAHLEISVGRDSVTADIVSDLPDAGNLAKGVTRPI